MVIRVCCCGIEIDLSFCCDVVGKEQLIFYSCSNTM